VIVLNPLLGREVVVDDCCADAPHLVGAHRRAHAATADCHSAFNLVGGDGPGERDDVVGIVIALAQAMSAEIDDLIPRSAKPAEQFFLQTKPAVIGGNTNAHSSLLAFAFESMQLFLVIRTFLVESP
jgi:hypothetical protein